LPSRAKASAEYHFAPFLQYSLSLQTEKNYSRWQLLAKPVSLRSFNDMPLLTSQFFDYSLRLAGDGGATPVGAAAGRPIAVRNLGSTSEPIDVAVWAWEPVRYKYKFFSATSEVAEDDSLNCYVFCFLRGRDRRLCVFRVSPPEVGSFFLKVYAKPEEEIASESDTLDHVATFVVHAIEVNTPRPAQLTFNEARFSYGWLPCPGRVLTCPSASRQPSTTRAPS